MMADLIKTERLLLRPFRIQDAEDVFAYASDEAWLRYLPLSVPYTRGDADRFLATQILLDRQEHPAWAIELQGKVAGGVNLRFLFDHRVAELGYAIARPLWGQGLTTEASRAVLGAAFEHYPELHRVRARADARNLGSIRVMEKLGMRREGLLREDRLARGEFIDEVIYGLLRREWQK
jgi:[ribosomal protein S5]-alanine N-acetyltransferase